MKFFIVTFKTNYHLLGKENGKLITFNNKLSN